MAEPNAPKSKTTTQPAVDKLTGLPRGDAFLSFVDNVVKAAPKKQWCFVIIDIEHFKLFDEWYGRETGDALLA